MEEETTREPTQKQYPKQETHSGFNKIPGLWRAYFLGKLNEYLIVFAWRGESLMPHTQTLKQMLLQSVLQSTFFATDSFKEYSFWSREDLW